MGERAENSREMAVPAPSSPERVPTPAPAPEQHNLIVAQPEKLGNLLDAIENLTSPQEAASRKPGENGTGSSAPATGTATQTALSPRDRALANLPPQEKIQKALRTHIHTEVRRLRQEASRLTASKPGAAHRINQIYANIRRLNKLLGELFHASYETLKHFFIRVFIDRQPIL